MNTYVGELGQDDVKEVLLKHRHLVKVTSDQVKSAISMIANDQNVRKHLSVMLGILVDPETFRQNVADTMDEITQSFDDLMQEITDGLDE